MDIDAMTRKGQGRDGKGESKDQMLSSWTGKIGKGVREKDTAHGKGKDTGEGYCGYCGKMGHRQRDC